MTRSTQIVGFVLVLFLLVGCQSPAAPATATATPVPPATPTAVPTSTRSPTRSSSGGVAKAVPTSVDEVPRITPQELKALLDAGESVVVVDTRGREAFEAGHIPGAGAMTLSEVDARYWELPKGVKIVFYCA